MKKLISVLLCVCMLFTLAVPALAWNQNDPVDTMDKQELIALFQAGKGPMTEGYAVDYRYYSPVKEGDTTQYPLVVWMHGMGEGGSDGAQLKRNDIAFWASADFQSRFVNGGAYILAVRSPEEQLNYWGEDTIYPLRAAIDDFIAKNAANVDISRIYIGGFSMGGFGAVNVGLRHPDIYSHILALSPGMVKPWIMDILGKPAGTMSNQGFTEENYKAMGADREEHQKRMLELIHKKMEEQKAK